jgi:hypothetical protein
MMLVMAARQQRGGRTNLAEYRDHREPEHQDHGIRRKNKRLHPTLLHGRFRAEGRGEFSFQARMRRSKIARTFT